MSKPKRRRDYKNGKGRIGRRDNGQPRSGPASKLTLNHEQLGVFASLGMTLEDMAICLDISVDFLYRYVKRSAEAAEAISKGRMNLNVSLRKAQLDEALNHRNTTLLVRLGEVYLGQARKSEIKQQHSIRMDDLPRVPDEVLENIATGGGQEGVEDCFNDAIVDDDT